MQIVAQIMEFRKLNVESMGCVIAFMLQIEYVKVEERRLKKNVVLLYAFYAFRSIHKMHR